jgi:hypothetical protein
MFLRFVRQNLLSPVQHTILTVRKQEKIDNWSWYSSICKEEFSDIRVPNICTLTRFHFLKTTAIECRITQCLAECIWMNNRFHSRNGMSSECIGSTDNHN